MATRTMPVSEACQINDLDHSYAAKDEDDAVSEACQINDLDHEEEYSSSSFFVSEACQINDLDHLRDSNPHVCRCFRSLSDQ